MIMKNTITHAMKTNIKIVCSRVGTGTELIVKSIWTANAFFYLFLFYFIIYLFKIRRKEKILQLNVEKHK